MYRNTFNNLIYKEDKMKRIIIISVIIICCAFAQVPSVPIGFEGQTGTQISIPDSVIVAKITAIEAEFNRNADMIRQLQDRQVFLNGQHIAWNDMLLLNKEEVVEEKE